MNEVELALIKKKSIKGIIALTSRTFLLQLIAFSATFLLTIFLSPAVFGLFYVVSAIISFLGYFSDIGLAAALIQKKEEVSTADLQTTFTIQQILVVSIVILAFLFEKVVVTFYKLDVAGLWLYRALVVSFLLSSLKTIPSVLLERKLNFDKLVIPQILETLGFYLVAVTLAWQGWGVYSFAWAVLTRGIVGLVAMYIICPWPMSLGISAPVAKRLLQFGIPFQLNSFLALVKDDLLTLFLGKVLPLSQVGYIGWAKKWAEVPLRLIMDSVIRVTFPAFSRLQQSKELLSKAIEKTLFGLSVSIFPITVGLLFFVKPLIGIVPRYGKWEPALMSFYLFAIGAAVASLSTPLTNALNAVGRIKVTLWLMVLWTTTTWLLTVVFIQLFGFTGFSLALLVVATTLFLVIYLAKQITQFSFIANVRSALVAATSQAAVYWLLMPYTKALPGLIASGIVGLVSYLSIIWLLERERIKGFSKSFFSA